MAAGAVAIQGKVPGALLKAKNLTRLQRCNHLTSVHALRVRIEVSKVLGAGAVAIQGQGSGGPVQGHCERGVRSLA